MTASVIDQNPPHDLRCDPEKVGAALPIDRVMLHQLDKGLVDQRRGLQSMIDSLPPHVGFRQPM
jgi:hypothetical protein